MARPTSRPAFTRAPVKEHPVAPAPAPAQAPSPASAEAAAAPPVSRDAPEALAMFSARINPRLRRRIKLYAAETDQSLQAITEAALSEYLDRNTNK
jgi:recombinational DNA repair protein (RecF pathway)